jgi:hypothetical protein
VLETAELFWITTVRANGRPHVTPLAAVWLDEALNYCTGSTEQKAVINLRGNGHVILTTGCNCWDEGLAVVVEDDAVQVTEEALLARLAEAWTKKWDGRRRYSIGKDGFVGDAGQGIPVFTFAKGAFRQTRHRL